MHINFRQAVLLAVVSISAPAFANSSASATLTDLTVTLYGDNPSISWNYYAGNHIQYGSIQDISVVFGVGELSQTVSIGNTWTSVLVSGSGPHLIATTLMASGYASDSSSFYSSAAGNVATFTLNATKAVFTATVSSEAVCQPAEGCQYAQAYGLLSYGNNNHWYQTGIESSAGGTPYFPLPNASWSYSGQSGGTNSGTISLTIIGNTSGSFGSYALATGISNYTPVSSIPEPETYVMMLAGLGLMGGIARRNSQAK